MPTRNLSRKEVKSMGGCSECQVRKLCVESNMGCKEPWCIYFEAQFESIEQDQCDQAPIEKVSTCSG